MTMPPCSASARSFFNIILRSTLHAGKMKIPTKFVKYHGDELGETVSLSTPTGCNWNVRIQRDVDSSIWLQDGFLQFMEDNFIGIEFFVVFKYRGGSQFSVLIFDLTATEIRYNCTNASATSDVNQMQNAEIVEGDDDSIECSGSSAGLLFNQRSTEPSKSPSTHNREKCFVSEKIDNAKQCRLTRRRKKMLNRGMAVDGSDGNISLKNKVENNCVGTSTSPREWEDKRTIEAEDLSSSTTFEVTLKSYNISKSILRVPRDFARLNMPPSSQHIKLIDSDNHEWVVRFHCNDNYCLAGGWPAFVKNKRLMAGDVCIFELIRGNQVKLKVNIYPSADGKNSKIKDETRFVGCDASPSDFKIARTVKAENSLLNNSFEVTLTPSYICNYLNVPPNFAPLLAPLNSAILVKVVDADNKEWVVRFLHKQGTHRLTKGWRQIVLDKKLVVGDICTFERVWGNEVKLKVTTTIPVE